MQLGNLELKWLGQSAFLIKSKILIYIDPFRLSNNPEKADLILITHSHQDHCSIPDLMKIVKDGTTAVMPADCQSKFSRIDKKINFINIEPGQEINVLGVDIKAVPAYNVDKKFHDKREYWNGYVILVEGKKIYHAGDTDLIPEMANLENIDVALLPIGGTYTMTADEAARAAILIKAKVVIPMHYGELVGSREDALRFMDRCKEENVKCELIKKE